MNALNKDRVIEKLENFINYEEFQLNKDFIRRDEIVGIVDDWSEAKYRNFKDLTIDRLRDLILEDFVYPFFQANNMPSLKDVYFFICKYPVIKVSGRVFSPSGRRPRYDLNIDTLTVASCDVSDNLVHDFIQFCKTADEVDVTNGLRSWWD